MRGAQGPMLLPPPWDALYPRRYISAVALALTVEGMYLPYPRLTLPTEEVDLHRAALANIMWTLISHLG